MLKIVVVADLHVNSTVGLFPEHFIRDDGAEVPQNKFQVWLWRNWLNTCEIAHQCGDYVVVVNGDTLQGINPSRDAQIVVPSRTDMIRAAKDVLTPLIDRAKATYILRGTDWHEGVSGQDVELLAESVHAEKSEETGQFSTWTLSIRLDDKLFAFSHHTPVATVYYASPLQREWREIKELFIDQYYQTRLGELPDCIVHSHVHHWYPYVDRFGRLSFTTPAWQLKNAYGYKNRPFYPPDIGSLILWVENERILWKETLYPIPQSRPVSLHSMNCSQNLQEPPKETRVLPQKNYESIVDTDESGSETDYEYW